MHATHGAAREIDRPHDRPLAGNLRAKSDPATIGRPIQVARTPATRSRAPNSAGSEVGHDEAVAATAGSDDGKLPAVGRPGQAPARELVRRIRDSPRDLPQVGAVGADDVDGEPLMVAAEEGQLPAGIGPGRAVVGFTEPTSKPRWALTGAHDVEAPQLIDVGKRTAVGRPGPL
jgi:hypothetical protein